MYVRFMKFSTASADSPTPETSAEGITLEALYRAHAADVSRWANRLGRSRIDPDDVVQEVFLIVRRRLGKFRGDAFRPWLFRITMNVISNSRRRIWFRGLLPGHSSVPEQVIPKDQWPDGNLDARERVACLDAMLGALPERERQALILFELEEMSGAEIAELMQVPAATVRGWLHRGRSRLARRVRQILEKEAP